MNLERNITMDLWIMLSGTLTILVVVFMMNNVWAH